MTTQTATKDPFTLSESAVRRVSHLMEQEGREGVFLRISVNGGGCSGFSYSFDFDDQMAADDIVVRKDGAVVAIDNMSLLYMLGCEVDFQESVMGSSFTIHNPNAASSCGCGSSFSI
jgi:iron-sulfur cluster assembly accessory protein